MSMKSKEVPSGHDSSGMATREPATSTGDHAPSSPDRRAFLRGLGGIGMGLAGLAAGMQSRAVWGGPPAHGKRVAKHCIVLYMHGGASHIDTFDPKPGSPTGGTFKAIQAATPGLRISEHLPQIARRTRDLAVVRSLTSREGNHVRARYLMHTGFVRQGGVDHPSLGAYVARHRKGERALPAYVSLGSPGHGAGFLGAGFAPFTVPDPTAPVRNLQPPRALVEARVRRREQMWRALESDFQRGHAGPQVEGSFAVSDRALAMSASSDLAAFDLQAESAQTRARYGQGSFGAGCLMARRLVEVGVPFVEVSLRGWDTHDDNFNRVAKLSRQLDRAWAALVDDLKANGKWADTMIVWMGDFGRTPKINDRGGRDHWPHASSVVLGGGVVAGGQVYGATDAEGARVESNPVTVADLFATLAEGLGVVGGEMHMTPRGRPVTTVDEAGRSISPLLA